MAPNSSQSTHALDNKRDMGSKSLFDYDRRVYLAKYYRTQLASGPAAFAAVIAGAPMENVKTRMQSKYFRNAWECTKYTYRSEGLRGFWAGTLPPLASLTISRVAGFSVYQKAKYYLDKVMEKTIGISPLNTVNTPGTYPTVYTIGVFGVSGCISGASLAAVLTPFELIKNATQTSVLMSSDSMPRGAEPGSVQPKTGGRISTYQAIKQIVERRGVLGLWTGFRLHLLRDTVGSGIYFGVYEAVKHGMTSYWQLEKANTMGPVAIAGAVCGMASWVATYPLDTMKTRAQNSLIGDNHAPTSQQDTLNRLTKAALTSKNPTALEKAAAVATASLRASKWKGVEMIIIRSSIQNMLQMLIFESIKNNIMDRKFSDGGTDLPKTRRERGRDQKVI